MSRATTRLRSGASGEHGVGVLTVPEHIMRHLRVGIEFIPELTADGILFRVVEPEDEDPGRYEWVARYGAET